MDSIFLIVLIIAGITESRQVPQLFSGEKDATSPDSCPLEGKWENHWAKLEFKCTADPDYPETGSLSGTFRNANSKPGDFYDIEGRYTFVNDDVTFGFVAAWNNKKAGNWKMTASWAGIYKSNRITAFWISAKDTDKPDLWNGFGVGKNVFNRATQSNRVLNI